MTIHIKNYREGFPLGITDITRYDEAEDNTGIALAVHKLSANEAYNTTTEVETAWLLMRGEVTIEVDGKNYTLIRQSLFDESPKCIHVSAQTIVQFNCQSDTEFTVYQVPNTKRFAYKIYTDVANEHRGKGQVGGACLRFVRTIFDLNNADPNAELVLGEVVTMPGRWSSYPPHHHPQPEIYHYRFTHPQGYGHAEHGEDVYKIKQFDTVKIFDGNDHPQTTAPGYGMWYSWVIRHLPDNPYTVPEFTPEHTWTQNSDAQIWFPEELKGNEY
ncbi:5-deoxy-glucuronate isomerase [Endozoicomonas sp. SM1973]|uniref:5-deoxy-glucuronate isomerase n=1 Tax=Spartinivicinus marinus TaxID=2994442 RepID=A0A853I2F3_9GAMM|nr:5-deoxy-glucuronate isomerase [Spartinivicinus marinus]MCX4025945.1 5-deoxy-glucuronate isomerase [Spartinivicinus marinus]NYZ68130.1 5-deoxy-glucuronate isomerase [Spartinivicinus marinus]